MTDDVYTMSSLFLRDSWCKEEWAYHDEPGEKEGGGE